MRNHGFLSRFMWHSRPRLCRPWAPSHSRGRLCHRFIALCGLLLAMAAAMAAPTLAPAAPDNKDEKVREIYIPFEDLNVLLEGGPQRVLLSREEYQSLMEKAREKTAAKAPREALLASADYAVTCGQERADIAATLVVNVLEDGLHTVSLDVAQVGLRTATLDDKAAALGLADNGQLTLFVEGKGSHTLKLGMVAPLQVTAATQVLTFRVPQPAAAHLAVTVPGDVEVKSGAPVVSRTFDAKAAETRFELLPAKGNTSLVMSLNSHLKRQDRVVMASSVVVDEVTQGYERLHATVSLAILHRATDRFRFSVPAGFEVTDVQTPLLARWALQKEGDARVLEVVLREETTDRVVLALSAVKTPSTLDKWSLPHLEPLDVVGHVAVVGLVLEERLKAAGLAPAGLIPIDTAVLTKALPATVLAPEFSSIRIRPIVAYYAPQGEFGLTAEFIKPPAKLLCTTNLLLTLSDKGQEVRGALALAPEAEKVFAFDFTAPAGWDVTSVTSGLADSAKLPFERYGEPDKSTRIHVTLPQGLDVGQEQRFYFQARYVPAKWFGDWKSIETDFPVFIVAGTDRDTGAVAVDARDDMIARADTVEGLVPAYDFSEAPNPGGEARLAYRFEGHPWKAHLVVERAQPRLTAQTYSFFKVERDALGVHYEVAFDIAGARTRTLSVLLPMGTPTALRIRGLDGVQLKDQTPTVTGQGADERRRWIVTLAEPRQGRVRLAIDFQSPQAPGAKDLPLPLVEADGVAYQSGLVAVEGSAELQVEVAKPTPREVDIGEFVDAEYQPGKRLIGTYGFLGRPPALVAAVSREPATALPPAIVERAGIATSVSQAGTAQSVAQFSLRTKAQFLEIQLPPQSVLWAVSLDGTPAKPQREGDRLLVSLPTSPRLVRDLQVVYETPAGGLGAWGGLQVPAPKLTLHATAGAAGQDVPAADLEWVLYLPSGYRVVRSGGSVQAVEVESPSLAVTQLASVLWGLGGGAGLKKGLIPTFVSVGTESTDDVAWVGGSGGAGGDGDRRGGYVKPPRSVFDMHMREDEGLAERLWHGIVGDKWGEAKSAAPPFEYSADVKAETEDGLSMDETDRSARATGAPAAPPASTDAPAPVRPTAIVAGPAAAKPASGRGSLVGVSSLLINIEPTANRTVFRSLGADPCLDLTVADSSPLRFLGWGLALAVLLAGLAMSRRTFRRKAIYIIVVALAATLAPILSGHMELAAVTNGMFWAALLLVVYYPVFSVARWVWRKVAAAVWPGAAVTTATLLLAVGLGLGGDNARAGETPTATGTVGPYIIQVVPPGPPLKVPDDALLIPYDPSGKMGPTAADKLLVPYSRFEDLWNRAYPEKPLGTKAPPAPYALAGAAFTATLQGDDYLAVNGTIELDIYTDEYVVVPLPLSGGVLARADLDGKPAKLSIADLDGKPVAVKGGGAIPASFLNVFVSGKGRHKLALEVRMHLEKQGGWRVAGGFLPAAPATSLSLKVPDAGTEVRLGSVRDRTSYETKAAGETIATALGATGALSVQWRPKVAEGQLDQALTATSRGVFDVQEDLRRVQWVVTAEFRKGEREFFTLGLPAGYLVEKVDGADVRGWEVRNVAPPPPAGAAAEGGRSTGGQELEVGLLKAAKGNETFTVTLWQSVAAPTANATVKEAEFDVPVVSLVGAVRQTGHLVINRSPMLSIRTVSAAGVTRADLPGARTGDDSPLGLKAFQAYDFAAVPFAVKLAVEPVILKTSATVQTIVRVAERERKLESRALLVAEDRPMYRVRLVLPPDLRLDHVQAPGSFEWAVTDEGGRRILTVYLGTGVRGAVSVLLDGKLGEGALKTMAVPRLEVLDVDRQEGDTVIQVDPSLDVQAEALVNVESVPVARTFGWLNDTQRPLARLALHYTRPDYSGRLAVSALTPDVSCFTVSNSRVTDRTIQDTILLDWTIRHAGIKEVVFLLPAWMKDARISVPLLREKTVTPVDAKPGAPVRVRLQLQDEVMDNLRVLVEDDRLLGAETHAVPIPGIDMPGTRVDRQYVALESAGRDEVVTDAADGLEALSRDQKEWAAVSQMLRGGNTQAFIVAAKAAAPRLAFHTQPRKAVETARARIGLAQTFLVLDETGAYRAEQMYRVDNRLEQFLEIRLPEGAILWTAYVNDEAVKPVRGTTSDPRTVRIPLIKTAAGELPYPVVLKYAGRMPVLGSGRASVSFPLVRTVNINVELSQVELYLPEEYKWFDFGGANRAADEGTYQAVEGEYLNKEAKNLVETAKFGTEFEKARAVGNFTNISSELTKFKAKSDQYADNKDVRDQFQAAATNWKDFDKVVKAQQPAAVVQTDARGNGLLINDVYSRQHNNPSKNLVTLSGANNYTGGTSVAEGTVNFNDRWLASNRLDNGSVAAVTGGTPAMTGTGGATLDLSGNNQAVGQSRGRLVIANPNAYDGQTNLNAGNLRLGGNASAQANASALTVNGGKMNVSTGQQAMLNDLEQQADKENGRRSQEKASLDSSQTMNGDVAAQTAARYRDKLVAQQKQQLEVVGTGGGGNHIGGFEGMGSSGGGHAGFFGAGGEEAQAATPAAPAQPTGLASLTVELPHRGRVYRFTAPRDVPEITGRVVSSAWLDSLMRFGEALVVIVAALVLWRCVRRTYTPQALSRISTAMIFLGAISLLVGFLWVVSVAVILWGVIIKIRLRLARRRVVMA